MTELKGPIVGVLKDFNTRSFRTDLAPLIITTFKKEYSQAAIKLAYKRCYIRQHAINRKNMEQSIILILFLNINFWMIK